MRKLPEDVHSLADAGDHGSAPVDQAVHQGLGELVAMREEAAVGEPYNGLEPHRPGSGSTEQELHLGPAQELRHIDL